MPRGVYDRSKTKEQRAAEKAAEGKAAAPKAKKGGRPKKVAAAAPAAPKAKKGGRPRKAEVLGKSVALVAPESNTLYEIRSNLQTLASLGPSSEVQAEIKANVELLAAKRREVVGLTRDEQAAEASASVEEETEEEPAAAHVAAPVPAVPYQNSIPMPPTPPSIQVPSAS